MMAQQETKADNETREQRSPNKSGPRGTRFCNEAYRREYGYRSASIHHRCFRQLG